MNDQFEHSFMAPFDPSLLEQQLQQVIERPFAVYAGDPGTGRVVVPRLLTPEEEDAVRAVVNAHIPPPPPVPSEIGPAQLRVALRRLHGITRAQLDHLITQVIASMPDAGSREDAQNLWEYSSVIKRDHPLVNVAASLLGLSSAQVDEVFRQGVEV